MVRTVLVCISFTLLCLVVGWLYKLWEVVGEGGAVVFSSEEWDAERIRPFIEKW